MTDGPFFEPKGQSSLFKNTLNAYGFGNDIARGIGGLTDKQSTIRNIWNFEKVEFSLYPIGFYNVKDFLCESPTFAVDLIGSDGNPSVLRIGLHQLIFEGGKPLGQNISLLLGKLSRAVNKLSQAINTYAQNHRDNPSSKLEPGIYITEHQASVNNAQADSHGGQPVIQGCEAGDSTL